MFQIKERVLTPEGTGTIRYILLSAPDYKSPTHYNIMLDRDSSGMAYNGEDPNYSGRMFPSNLVKKHEQNHIVWGPFRESFL